MTFPQIMAGPKLLRHGAVLAVGALALVACATTDDTVNSHLTQPVGGSGPMIEAGDIAIAGQDFARSIRDLPQVAGAPKPPMVQFPGVTSVVTGKVPVDTDPYTNLLRDRLVLVCREKLRFVERQLPPLITKKSKHKEDDSEAADYQVLAELRGSYDDSFYKIQMQFLDIHTGEVLFNGLYHIRKEAPEPQPDISGASTPPAQNQLPATTSGTPVLQ